MPRDLTPPDVRGWTIVNIAMSPYDLIAADKAAGVDQSATFHSLAYLAHGEAPIRMMLPQPPMQDMVGVLGKGTILRMPVNQWQFANPTAEGADTGKMLDAEHQRMIDEWVAAGGRLLPVHAWLGQEDWPIPVRAAGPQAMIDYLRTVPETIAAGWQRFGRWLEQQPQATRDVVVGLETQNEPAIYDRAIKEGLLPREVVIEQFVDDNIAIARDGMDWWDGPVLVPLFAYSARTEELLVPLSDGRNGIERLRDAFGNRLVWSAHRYPSWNRNRDAEKWRDTLLAGLEPLKPDPVAITETNADLSATEPYGFAAARVWGEIARLGYGIGWFSTANYGQSLLTYWGVPTIRRIDRMAVFWDVATANDRRGGVLRTDMRIARSPLDARGGFDSGLVRVTGEVGGDRIDGGIYGAPVMIYGNASSDTIKTSRTHATWIFGGPGDDVIDASEGPFALIVLGPGHDRVLLGGDQVHVSGLGGGDTYVLAPRGTAVIEGFVVGEDRIDAAGIAVSGAADGADLLIHADAGTVRLLGHAKTPLASAVL